MQAGRDPSLQPARLYFNRCTLHWTRPLYRGDVDGWTFCPAFVCARASLYISRVFYAGCVGDACTPRAFCTHSGLITGPSYSITL